MNMTIPLRYSACLAALAASLAQTPSLRAGPIDPNRHMTVDQLTPGMKGFGKSVFRGTEIATFQAEVVSVIKNFDPKLDVILVRLSGQNLEHSGVIGGMSGSPIYIKSAADAPARLIGAVAYGWYFNKDPLCGVQPIQHMLDVSASVRRRSSQRPNSDTTEQTRTAHLVTGQGRYALAGLMNHAARRWPRPWADDAELRPLATPIMTSGASAEAMNLLKDYLEPYNLIPIAAGGGANPEGAADEKAAKIEPGSALCIPMVTGDVSMSAFGTCTEVIGDHVYGFGHSFTHQGPVEFPMAGGVVHAVIASVRRSFKLGSPLNIQGAIVGDETAAIYGLRSKSARMIPFQINVDEMGSRRTYRYQCINDEFFTPMLGGAVLVNSITALSGVPLEHTIRYQIEVNLGKQGTFKSRNITSQSGIFWAMGELAGPMMALMDNQFGRFRVESIKADITIENRAQLARLEQINLAETTVKPGHTLDVRTRWRHYRRPFSVEHYPIELPEDITEGTYRLTLTSSLGHLRELKSEKPHLFTPDNQQQLIETFNRIGSTRQNVLYARFLTQDGGIAVNKEELPDLPGHRRAILAEASRRETNPFKEPFIKMFELPFVMEGEATATFTVDKRADQ